MEASAAPLFAELEARVQTRTGRRVRNLAIQLDADRIVLRGQANSYYVKELARQGVQEILPRVRLENDIAVERGMLLSVN